MAATQPEIIEKLTAIQETIWETATTAVTESGTALTFGSPLSVSTKVAELPSELSGQIGSIQFSFAHSPEEFQLVLIPQDTLLELASLLTVAKVKEADENTLTAVRPVLEAIVQGICLSVGNLRQKPVAASGLTIRCQDLALPPNIEALEEAYRMQIAVTGEGVSGALIWLMDPNTASFICGLEDAGTDADTPFAQLSADPALAVAGAGSHDEGALDFLMDIPLEISVELGRVKMLVRDVIELGTGSIVEIDKAAGEPVDVMVNGRLVAKGEVVVIEDNFGVRITEILSTQERLMRLAEVA